MGWHEENDLSLTKKGLDGAFGGEQKQEKASGGFERKVRWGGGAVGSGTWVASQRMEKVQRCCWTRWSAFHVKQVGGTKAENSIFKRENITSLLCPIDGSVLNMCFASSPEFTCPIFFHFFALQLRSADYNKEGQLLTRCKRLCNYSCCQMCNLSVLVIIKVFIFTDWLPPGLKLP